jgi:2-hydroxycyclohexanecarboxyl-CoA dehydrogenase
MERGMRGLDRKVVVVTGGGRGIGAATSHRFASEGSTVAVVDIDLDAAEAVGRSIEGSGGRAGAYRCDIANQEDVMATLSAIRTDLGPIDVLVNNAGWDAFRPFLKTSPADWEKLISVNLRGPLNMHYGVLPEMVERRSGRIVNIASDAARVGSSGEAVYSACKAGLLAFSKTIAREHSRDGITLNVVCPGPTKTALFAGFLGTSNAPDRLEEAFKKSVPLGRLGVPEDLPGAICFFASDDAAYITGQVLSVSGGLTMVG